MSLLKVGEIAKKTGLTVRALHHYDDIGLLTASCRSDTGYRLYTHDDLMQLQKIKSLQSLGFSLEEIARIIQSDAESLSDILNKHLNNLVQHIEQQQVLIQRLQNLVDVIQQGQSPTVEMLLDTLRVTIMFEKYYSPDQMAKLAEIRDEIGEESIKEMEQEWQTMYDTEGGENVLS